MTRFMHNLPDRVSKLWLCRRGSAAVQSAFVLPLFLLALLGTIEMGRLAWAQSALNFAVQETTRCASVTPDLCGTPAKAATFAAGKVAALDIPAEAFEMSSQDCGTQVRATVEHKLILYKIWPSNPTLTAEFCRP